MDVIKNIGNIDPIVAYTLSKNNETLSSFTLLLIRLMTVIFTNRVHLTQNSNHRSSVFQVRWSRKNSSIRFLTDMSTWHGRVVGKNWFFRFPTKSMTKSIVEVTEVRNRPSYYTEESAIRINGKSTDWDACWWWARTFFRVRSPSFPSSIT